MFSLWVSKALATAFSVVITPVDCLNSPAGTFFDLSASSGNPIVQSHYQITTDLTGKVRVRASVDGCSLYMQTLGFIDNRGRFD